MARLSSKGRSTSAAPGMFSSVYQPKFLDSLDELLSEDPTVSSPVDRPPVILTGEYIPENFLLAPHGDRLEAGWPDRFWRRDDRVGRIRPARSERLHDGWNERASGVCSQVSAIRARNWAAAEPAAGAHAAASRERSLAPRLHPRLGAESEHALRSPAYALAVRKNSVIERAVPICRGSPGPCGRQSNAPTPRLTAGSPRHHQKKIDPRA